MDTFASFGDQLFSAWPFIKIPVIILLTIAIVSNLQLSVGARIAWVVSFWIFAPLSWVAYLYFYLNNKDAAQDLKSKGTIQSPNEGDPDKEDLFGPSMIEDLQSVLKLPANLAKALLLVLGVSSGTVLLTIKSRVLKNELSLVNSLEKGDFLAFNKAFSSRNKFDHAFESQEFKKKLYVGALCKSPPSKNSLEILQKYESAYAQKTNLSAPQLKSCILRFFNDHPLEVNVVKGRRHLMSLYKLSIESTDLKQLIAQNQDEVIFAVVDDLLADQTPNDSERIQKLIITLHEELAIVGKLYLLPKTPAYRNAVRNIPERAFENFRLLTQNSNHKEQFKNFCTATADKSMAQFKVEMRTPTRSQTERAGDVDPHTYVYARITKVMLDEKVKALLMEQKSSICKSQHPSRPILENYHYSALKIESKNESTKSTKMPPRKKIETVEFQITPLCVPCNVCGCQAGQSEL